MPMSTPTVVMTSQMMKIFPAGREKNGSARTMESPCSRRVARAASGTQTTWTNPDMYPKAFMGPPKAATDVPHGYSQFHA